MPVPRSGCLGRREAGQRGQRLRRLRKRAGRAAPAASHQHTSARALPQRGGGQPPAAAPRRGRAAALATRPARAATGQLLSERGTRDAAMPRARADDGDADRGGGGDAHLARLMSKKIAQLTKVVYHVNTTNEDHQLEVEALRRAHREELAAATKDAASKVRDLSKLVERKKEDETLRTKLDLLEKAHARDKADAQKAARKKVAETKAELEETHSNAVEALRVELGTVQNRFQVAARAFRDARAKAGGATAKEMSRLEAELEALKRSHARDLEDAASKAAADLEVETSRANARYDAMVRPPRGLM